MVRAILISISFAIAANAASAQGNPPRPVKHQRVATYISWGNPGSGGGNGTPLMPGTNDVDAPMTITCGQAAGCTFEIDAMVGIGRSATGTQFWAICALVDGNNLTSPSCWNQGIVTANGIVTGNSSQSVQVAQGKHTVQTQVFVADAINLQDWHIDYVVMTP